MPKCLTSSQTLVVGSKKPAATERFSTALTFDWELMSMTPRRRFEINGIRRGERMDPLLVKPAGNLDNLAGFELSPADEVDLSPLKRSFTSLGERSGLQDRYSLQPASQASVRETLLTSDMGVLPLGETALARQFEFSFLRRLETTQPRPAMTGPTKSEEHQGMKLPHRWDRGFPRRREAPRTPGKE